LLPQSLHKWSYHATHSRNGKQKEDEKMEDHEGTYTIRSTVQPGVNLEPPTPTQIAASNIASDFHKGTFDLDYLER
jgi:hypothetical protein